MIMYFWNEEKNNCFCLCIFIDIGRPEKWNSAKVYAELITASFLKKKSYIGMYKQLKTVRSMTMGEISINV